ADQAALSLRAGDALHLALCADNGATMCTLDQSLAKAAPLVGVEAVLL
ncbi:MAG: VapC toxin family PIN domain ribonuclease, partial [Alphaproteobacteria bacterium]|nr:VapC toxin family PIN domain ribonuclease [Alphaproteobacteria bacterium]